MDKEEVQKLKDEIVELKVEKLYREWHQCHKSGDDHDCKGCMYAIVRSVDYCNMLDGKFSSVCKAAIEKGLI